MKAPGAITVIARWHVAGENVQNVLALIAQLRELTLSEPGCLAYDAFQSTETPGLILLIERYRDDAAIAAHRESAHYLELVGQRILPMLSGREVELLRALYAG